MKINSKLQTEASKAEGYNTSIDLLDKTKSKLLNTNINKLNEHSLLKNDNITYLLNDKSSSNNTSVYNLSNISTSKGYITPNAPANKE